ncbi:fibrobacter succinogenes major paralogous domain-containing protein [Flavobacteriales bacterium]|nr:fibrobacter succinogenes major paralogous domain-containing protein [Flavobacteriales bacterium]
MKCLTIIITCLFALTLTAQEVVIEYPYNPDFENDGNVGVEDLLELLSSFGMAFEVGELTIDEVVLSEWLQTISQTLIAQQSMIDSLMSDEANSEVSQLDSALIADMINEAVSATASFGERVHLGEPEGWGPLPWDDYVNYGTYDFDDAGIFMGRFQYPFNDIYVLHDSLDVQELSSSELQNHSVVGESNGSESFSVAVGIDERIIVKGLPGSFGVSDHYHFDWMPLVSSSSSSNNEIYSGESLGPCQGELTVNYHGYDYELVEIGDQCWFAEDLQTSTFSNGDEIEQNWNWANFDDPWGMPTCQDHGGWIYNGPARIDQRNLCPADFKVPTELDWSELMVKLYGQYLTSSHMNYSGINLHSYLQDYNNNPTGDCVELIVGGGYYGLEYDEVVLPQGIYPTYTGAWVLGNQWEYTEATEALGMYIRCLKDTEE